MSTSIEDAFEELQEENEGGATTKKRDAVADPLKIELSKASVKRIMKLNKEVHQISAEGVTAMCKVTEQFMFFLAYESYEVAAANGRKTIKVCVIVLLVALGHNSHFSSSFSFLNHLFARLKI